MKKKPVRTCCSCKKKMLKDQLNRFVWKDGAIQLDAEQRMAGRGAYSCREKQCMESFLRQEKKWKRVFRL